jgi:hypothetical protein
MVYPVRHHRRGCAAELAGAASTGELDRGAVAVSPQRGGSADRLRALRLLAAAPNGATEAISWRTSSRPRCSTDW